MSDDTLVVFPADPTAVPDQEVAARARDLLASMAPGADRIEVVATDEIRFIDAGSNFDGVACPACGADLDLDWWGGEMGRAFESGFEDLAVAVPCCGADTSLNDLGYVGGPGLCPVVGRDPGPGPAGVRAGGAGPRVRRGGTSPAAGAPAPVTPLPRLDAAATVPT